MGVRDRGLRGDHQPPEHLGPLEAFEGVNVCIFKRPPWPILGTCAQWTLWASKGQVAVALSLNPGWTRGDISGIAQRGFSAAWAVCGETALSCITERTGFSGLVWV